MESELTIDGLELAEQSDNDDQCSTDEERNQENVDQDQDKVPTNTPVSAKPSIISSLQNICNDPEENKDTKFLDNLQKVFEDNETNLTSTS